MAHVEKTERNLKIYELRQAGKTFKAIGEEFGLSVATVRDIYNRHARRLAAQSEHFDRDVIMLRSRIRRSLEQAKMKEKATE